MVAGGGVGAGGWGAALVGAHFGLDAVWNPQANDRARWLLGASLALFPVPLAELQVRDFSQRI